MLTTENVLKKVDKDIKRKREEVNRLHGELDDLMDYLDVVSARQRALGKRAYTQEEMEKRYGVK
ncbi:MAG: hypothetical protein PHV34_21000 [Verrucomicrobiae bacterium]|nr:hypothetical protein [Verrucomicrobiae bacterium]